MKRTLIAATLCTLSTSLMAESRELSLGKGLEFKVSHKQDVEKVEVSEDRITLIQSKDAQISSVRACAHVSLKDSEFNRLESILFTTGSLVPSANLKSKYGGSRTGIGSNDISITADFPDELNKGNTYKVDLTAALSSTDPANKSSARLSSTISKNGEIETESESSNELKSERYNFVKMVMTVQDREGFEISWSVPPKLLGMIESYMKPTDLEHEFLDTPLEYSTMAFVESKLKLSNTEGNAEVPKEGKISVCWRTNNYSSITTEGAQLLRPKLTLKFK